MPKYAVIIVGAGNSSRFSGEGKKQFADIDGRAAWLRSADVFLKRSDVSQVIFVIAEEDQELVNLRYGAIIGFMHIKVTLGGKTRTESVIQGLAMVHDDVDYVAIHDAARPCITESMMNLLFDDVLEFGATIPVSPIVDSLKKVNQDNVLQSTENKKGLYLAQTPQVFRADILQQAYAGLSNDAAFEDDASVVQAAGHSVHTVVVDRSNIKLTFPEDIQQAEAIIKSRLKRNEKLRKLFDRNDDS